MVEYVVTDSEKLGELTKGWKPEDFLPLIVEIDNVRMTRDRTKLNLRKEIDKAKSAIRTPTCNQRDLIDDLHNIYTIHGTADALSDFFPEDKDARSLKKESLDLLDLGDDRRFRFLKECKCQKKEK